MYPKEDDVEVEEALASLQQRRRELRLRRLWRRDGPGCFYCSCPLTVEKATFDHFIPKAKGGPDALENQRVACEPCNNAKGHMLPDEWAAYRAKRRAANSGPNHRPRLRPSRLHVTLADIWPQGGGR